MGNVLCNPLVETMQTDACSDNPFRYFFEAQWFTDPEANLHSACTRPKALQTP